MKKMDYFLIYQTHNNTGLQKTNFIEKQIYREKFDSKDYSSIHIDTLYNIDNNMILLRTSLHGTILYDIKNNKIIIHNQDIYVYGYLSEEKLFLARVFEDKNNNLYLYDLNFKKIKLITNQSAQFDNLVLSKNEFIFSKIDQNHTYQYWLYNVKKEKKVRLFNLENKCRNLKVFRNKTNQILCTTLSNKSILIDLFSEKIDYIDIDIDISKIPIIYYDEKEDGIFAVTTVFNYLKLQEINNLDFYYFNTKKTKRLISDIYVKGMDKVK